MTLGCPRLCCSTPFYAGTAGTGSSLTWPSAPDGYRPLVRHGADAQAAIALVLGVPVEQIGVR
jgi:hypothetical protein